MRSAILFHDGCGICLGIAATFEGLFSSDLVAFEAVNLGRDQARYSEAESAGITQLPSLVIDGRVMPIDPHSDLDHLKPRQGDAA